MRHLTGEDNSYLMGELKEYRYLPEEYAHSETLVIFKDHISSPLQGQEKSVIIIEDKAASSSLRNLFEFVWSVTKSPKETTANERY
jgi:cAMP phosphodiesterase